jgi:paraquat-inducible protein B
MSDEQANTPARPDIQQRRWHVSLVWVVPLVAALIGLSMLIREWQQTGPTIEILFESGEGLSAGKTPVQYRDVTIGRLTDVALSKDHSGVVATVQLGKDGEAFMREDSRFWVVRLRVGASGVSGVETLLSGGYIAADPGTSSATKKRFEGLESPPQIIHDPAGSRFLIQAESLGALNVSARWLPTTWRIPVSTSTSRYLSRLLMTGWSPVTRDSGTPVASSLIWAPAVSTSTCSLWSH